MTYGAGQPPYGQVPSWGGGPHEGREELRHAVRQYGHMEDAEDQVIDPKVLEAESRRLGEERAARGGRAAVSMLWTREGGLERVSRPHPPEPSASQKPSEKKPGEEEEEGLGFADLDFQDPPPPPPAWDLGAMDIPNSWPTPSGDWPSMPNSHNVPSPYGLPSPYGPPHSYPPPSAPWPTQGGSW